MDCDGVIFNSNPAKSEVFDIVLAAYPPAEVAQVQSLLHSQGGLSRYVFLQRFFTEIHPVEDVGSAVEQALVTFGDASRAAYRSLQPLPEALEFAERMGGAEWVTVVSGSDQQELRAVFDEHGISHRFRDVLGSPTTKPVHIQAVLQALGQTDGLMVGDGRADFEAARALDLDFVFLAEYSDWTDAATALRGAPRTQIVQTWQELLALTDRG
jgi:phosphoglycolate phosphatase-like HAD superfamily hydrolase